jgi:hypothetical protein
MVARKTTTTTPAPISRIEVVQYTDGIASYGPNPTLLTVGHLKAMIERLSIPDDTVLIGSSDEEGNHYGRIFVIGYSAFREIDDDEDFYEVEGVDVTGRNLLVLQPAI